MMRPAARLGFLGSTCLAGLVASAALAVQETPVLSPETATARRPIAPLIAPVAQPKDPRFDDLIGRLARETSEPIFAQRLAAGEPFPVEALSDALRSAVDAGFLRIDPDGAVQVYIHLDEAERSALASGSATAPASLQKLGCRVELADAEGGTVQARVPFGSLEQAASVRGVRHIGSPRYAVTDEGSKLTAGDLVLRASQTRAQYGVDGAGVKVGVISDGIYQMQGAIATGDLPVSYLFYQGYKLVGTSGGVISVSFRADRDLEAGLSGGRGSEGVAMLEIVHDLAPGAQLYFANFSTDLEFNKAVNFLAENCDVVVDDISFFGGPYDGTSSVSANAAAALNDPGRPIRAFFTSAGNRALDHYEEPYTASTLDGMPYVGASGRFHQFGPSAKTSDAFGLGPRPQNQIYLYKNQGVSIILSWDDPAGASANDYDLFLFRSGTGALVASSRGAQNGSQAPSEIITFTNTGASGFFDLRVQNYLDQAQPRSLEIFIVERPFRTIFGNRATLTCNTSAGSIAMMADAGGGVLSVGAIDASDPGVDTIEEYSSWGPTNDGRLKPEIASVDGVAVTGVGGFPAVFYGTSASAPHAAAVAALMLQMAPCLQGPAGDPEAQAERALLRALILDHAFDLGAAGPDEIFGHGRNDAFDAATPMLPVADPGTPPAAAECSSPAGAAVTLDASASRAFLPTCPLSVIWTGPFGALAEVSPTVTLPLGRHEITLEVSQNGGATRVTAPRTIAVQDTRPPALAGVAAPAWLWPPNHRLQKVVADVAVQDACDERPAVTLAAVTSSEPDDAAGAGDGQTAGDIQDASLGAPDDSVALRAERDGAGPGRVYGIQYVATDASGNAATLDLSVRVPHDAGPGATGDEPMLLELPDSATVRWNEVPGARAYQLVRGTLDRSAIQITPGAAGLGPAVCLSSGSARAVADAGLPPPGAVFFYLGRYDDGTGFTGFGAVGGMKDLQAGVTPCR